VEKLIAVRVARGTMHRVTLGTIYSQDNLRRVQIFRREDGTFGFDEEKYAEKEQCWIPLGFNSICDSQERAFTEARGRIPWLSEHQV